MDKLRDKLIAERKSGLGGTDMGAILGVASSFKTRYQVWEEKTSDSPPEQNTTNYSMMLGNLLEYPLMTKYEALTGKKVIPGEGSAFFKAQYPFFIAHVDGYIPEENRIVEIKTANEFTKDKWGPSGSQLIPEHYYAQVAHYMYVLGYERADVLVGFINQKAKEAIDAKLAQAYLNQSYREDEFNDIPDLLEIRIYSFEKDPEIESIIEREGLLFWNNHVLPKIPPEKEYRNKHFMDYVKRAHPSVSAGKTVVLDDSLISLKEKYLKLTEDISKLEQDKQAIKNQVRDCMQDAEIAMFSDGDYFRRQVVQRKETKASEFVQLTFKKKAKDNVE